MIQKLIITITQIPDNSDRVLVNGAAVRKCTEK